MASKKHDEYWVAGIYVRETAMSFVVGQIDVPEDFEKTRRVSGKPIPKTKERRENALEDFIFDGRFSTPEQFLEAGAIHLRRHMEGLGKRLHTVHVACFGAFSDSQRDDDAKPEDYGVLNYISPYPTEWQGINIYRIFLSGLTTDEHSPTILIGTDVNAAAFGEFHWECRDKNRVGEQDFSRDPDKFTLVCLNFSRTISGGVVRHGSLWKGASLPLMSIIRPRRFTAVTERGETWTDLYHGNCKIHKDCIEGLIGANAIADRCGLNPETGFNEVPEHHAVWDVFVYYAAQLCVTITGILSPNAIILTGRCIPQIDAPEIAQARLQAVRDAFYIRLAGDNGRISPSYSDLKEREDFIRLPRSPDTINSKLKGGRPGRHGAVRLAAAHVLAELDPLQGDE